MPIPAVGLGRLAVDGQWQARGIGRGLLKDAVLRGAQVRLHVGARVLLCHAIAKLISYTARCAIASDADRCARHAGPCR